MSSVAKRIGATDHAIVRAKERLNLTKEAFYGWVASTKDHWIAVNDSYLHDFGVRVSQHDVRLFVTPWVFDQNVCLVVSRDWFVKTVIPYRNHKVILGHTEQRVANAVCQLQRDLKLNVTEQFRLLCGLKQTQIEGPKVIEAIDLYLSNTINVREMLEILRTRHELRNELLERVLARAMKRAEKTALAS